MDVFSAFTDGEACEYFFVLMVFNFLILVVSVISILLNAFASSSEKSPMLFFLVFVNIFEYFKNRLLYSMCAGKLSMKNSNIGFAGSGSTNEKVAAAIGLSKTHA